MMTLSEGILMWRRGSSGIELLLVHFGGPFWAKRDDGAWTIPKGLVENGEGVEEAARREFAEELGTRPEGALTPLGRIRQKGGKWVEAFALEGKLDTESIVSKSYALEWPPRSGKIQHFPEVDRAAWYPLDEARSKILPSQSELLHRLLQILEAQ